MRVLVVGSHRCCKLGLFDVIDGRGIDQVDYLASLRANQNNLVGGFKTLFLFTELFLSDVVSQAIYIRIFLAPQIF